MKENSFEKPVLEMTQEELAKYPIMETDNPELSEWMKRKNIQFGQGLIDVKIDGKISKMQTNKNDFGTFEYYQK